jgi:hypothetical protein
MKRNVWMILLAISPILGFLSIADAKSSYQTRFNTRYGTAGSALDNCTVCHTSVPARNSFGTDFASSTIPGHIAHAFDAALEARDSDSDGFTNITEINAKTFPGDPGSHPAGSDTTAPTVTGFSIPSTSNSLTVSITTFTATDNVAVTGYKTTESPTAPSASDPGWVASAPSNYTFATAGAKTLYAWAKDEAGNVSTSRSASTTITFSDTTPPTAELSIVSFSAPRKANIALTATDDAGGSGVAGYMVKQSFTPPPISSTGWAAAPPASFKFPATATPGPQTLYAWAKDKAGNVSAPVSVQVDLDLTRP